ncbi:glycosyltransferase family 2 protein [Roseateles sp.]|uniref:glycosyltransferase family 2 protein n=1 Tax=Roseateles sp. TaxID=1971397 RepID=UPI003266A252
MSVKSTLSLSIVSHGQGHLIRPLLAELAERPSFCHELILTLNVPEDESFFADFDELPIQILRNENPKGFGANHNAAFKLVSGSHFVVVNPDIRLDGLQPGLLLEQLKDPRVGIAAPVVYSSTGQLQDSARRFPTLARLLSRRLTGDVGPDYQIGIIPIDVDWVAGMFMVFRTSTYHELQGFDERYFMYFEDVDLCRRLHGNGYSVMLVPSARVIHDAQRASRRKFRHFVWHIASAARFLAKI